MGRAADIADLEKMLNDGEGDEALCDRAIEIFERLSSEAQRFKYSGDVFEKKRLTDEVRDFESVIGQIEQRRHKHALDKFNRYLDGNP